MSSLWTPGGEHPVDRPNPRPSTDGPGGPDEADDARRGYGDIPPEELAALADDIDEVRRQLAQVPPEIVVANHAMGCYELAAIHLQQQPPNFEAARLAVDAMGALVEGLPGRLGEAEATLRDALAQIRLVWAQMKATLGS